MDFSKLIDWVKLSPKYLLPIGVVSGFLLFANEAILVQFGLKEFMVVVRPWVGIIFLLTVSLITVNALWRFFY